MRDCGILYLDGGLYLSSTSAASVTIGSIRLGEGMRLGDGPEVRGGGLEAGVDKLGTRCIRP